MTLRDYQVSAIVLNPRWCIQIIYSQVPNKRVGHNKRVGWFFWANFINNKAQINLHFLHLTQLANFPPYLFIWAYLFTQNNHPTLRCQINEYTCLFGTWEYLFGKDRVPKIRVPKGNTQTRTKFLVWVGLGLCLNSMGIFRLGTHQVSNFVFLEILPLGTHKDWVPKIWAQKGDAQLYYD